MSPSEERPPRRTRWPLLAWGTSHFEGVGLLVEVGMQASKGAARRLASQGGVYINNVRVTEVAHQVTLADLASDNALVLRCGKKDYHLVELA